jgi:hypothetical protein
MRIPKLFRVFLVWIALPGMLLLAVLYTSFIVVGGYWENMPMLSSISGPMRFRQFVVDPVPETVYDLRGGYSGFPQGELVTWFRFKRYTPFQPPVGWRVVYPQHLKARFEQGHALRVTRMFQKDEHEIYILLDETTGRGVLYMP